MEDVARRLVSLEKAAKRQSGADAMWEGLSFVPYTAALPQPYAANADTHVAAQPSVAVALAQWVVATYVVAPNDGANYWTVRLLNAAAATLVSFTTGATPDTAGVWTRHTVASGWTNPIAATNVAFFVQIAKTGAPGAIYVAPSLYVRNGAA